MGMEWVGVIFSWVCKWYKASGNTNHRKTGFLLACGLNLFWGVYFFSTEQYGLVLHAIVGMYFIARGINNNLCGSNNG